MTRSTVGWSEEEEEKLLAWLESNREMTWKALTHAYCQQFQVNRSVESLRGKMYHILRKHRHAGVKPTAKGSQSPTRIHRKRPARVGKARPVHRQIDRWLQGLPMTESSQADCSDSTVTKSSTTRLPWAISDCTQLKEKGKSRWTWESVHRFAVARKSQRLEF